MVETVDVKDLFELMEVAPICYLTFAATLGER